MTDAQVEIPAELLPSDGRFGSGPSKVRSQAVDALVAVAPRYLGTSHRQAGVRAVISRLRQGITDLFSLPEGYEVALGNGGAAAFWDIAAYCLVERQSQHCSFGEFSSKFAKAAAAPHLAPPQVIASEAGTHPEPEADPAVDTYGLTHNETSTGVQMEIRRPRDSSGAVAAGLVVVDATSAAGGLRFDPSETDVYFFSPQKCFGSDGGLWIAVLSPAAVDRSARLAASGRRVPAFLDLNLALESSRLDQTYNTPALATLFLLAEQLDWFNSHGGLEWAASRSDRSADILYGWAERSSYATPFVAKPDERSRVVGTIDFNDEVSAALVASTLRANGVVDIEPYRRLGRNQLRVAMYPGIDSEDLEALVSCIDYVVGRTS